MNEQKEFLKKEFLDWWYGYDISEDNLYCEDSPLYWAWEGFLVGLRVEREACAKLAEEFVETKKRWHTGDLMAAIKARGEVK